MDTATVTSKGQITIPVEVRRAMRLEPGSKVSFVPMGDGLYRIVPIRGSVMDMAGFFDSGNIHATLDDMDRAITSYSVKRYNRSRVDKQ
jgi:AbrB family looped-hinge helix DNA binding protein